MRALEPDEVLWFAWQEGRFVTMPCDPDGLCRSRAFPGLWLDPRALLAHDTAKLRGVVEQGILAPEHAAYVAALARARTSH